MPHVEWQASTEWRMTMTTETLWTEGDEKVFQELLNRRAKATAAVIDELRLTEAEIDGWACSLAEDYDPQIAWENYLAHAGPEEIRDDVESLRS
jgi:hypothetical protein